MRRTRKELKAEIRDLHQDMANMSEELAAERRKFAAVNDRCGKAIHAINEARNVLTIWPR